MREGVSRPIIVLVNGGPSSAGAERARVLFAGLDHEVLFRDDSRKVASARRFIQHVWARPSTGVYVVDMAWSGVVAGLAGKIRGHRMVIDTGDAAYALARSAGRRGRLGLLATWVLEEAGLRMADLVIVRGLYHKLYLRDRGIHDLVVIPDFASPSDHERCVAEGKRLREQLFPTVRLVVGVVGSLVWNRRRGSCYGLELVEALAALRDIDVHGLIVGDGDGLPHLRAAASHLGVADRIRFTGAVPPRDVGAYVCAMDVCLSTQTDDLPGWVRTTGKLPLYLEHDRYILASDVGQATWCLPPEMRVQYTGSYDRLYPRKLAARLRELADHPGRLRLGGLGQDIARREFSPDQLRDALVEALRSALR
jgi:glycosyltransferase involved in cell wall biosynthesis